QESSAPPTSLFNVRAHSASFSSSSDRCSGFPKWINRITPGKEGKTVLKEVIVCKSPLLKSVKNATFSRLNREMPGGTTINGTVFKCRAISEVVLPST